MSAVMAETMAMEPIMDITMTTMAILIIMALVIFATCITDLRAYLPLSELLLIVSSLPTSFSLL
jgi:hypothetical protein